MRMKDLDGDRGCWNGGKGILEDDRLQRANRRLSCPTRAEIRGRYEVMLEGSAVNLGNSTCSYGILVKGFEYLVEWTLEYSLDDVLCVGKRVRGALRVQGAEFLTEKCWEEIGTRSGPLRQLQ